MLKRKAQWKLGFATILALAMLFLGSRSSAGHEPTAPVFSTWDNFEVDKLASIWLIKCFIHPEARIKLYPKGDPITEGIPFDTPDAKFRRYHNASTYEMLRRHYKITDPRCVYVARIVHDVEINTWEKKLMPETDLVIDDIQDIITSSSSSDEVITRAVHYFNNLAVR